MRHQEIGHHSLVLKRYNVRTARPVISTVNDRSDGEAELTKDLDVKKVTRHSHVIIAHGLGLRHMGQYHPRLIGAVD
jgi:hypothetical protein